MKSLISLILLVTIFNDRVTCAEVSNSRLAAEVVIQQLNEVISMAATEKDVELPFPLPIEDRYDFDWAELSLPGEIFSFNVNISMGSVSGLSEFRLLELDFSNTEPTIGISILFPLLKFHAEHYALDGNIYYAVPIKGEGVAHLEIYNLHFQGTLSLKLSSTSNSMLFDKLENAEFNIERIVSRTEFDQNIDDIISSLVEDLLADYLNRFNKYMTATYSDTVIQYINGFL